MSEGTTATGAVRTWMVTNVRTGDRNETDLAHWGTQRLEYSRARHGRHERGASLGECALVAGMAQAMSVRSCTETGAKDGAASANEAAA